MCKACEELEGIAAVSELQVIALVDELEHVALLAGGFTIPDAVRDLLPHERQAKVKFRDMFDLMAKGSDDLNAAIANLSLIAHRELLAALGGNNVLAALADLRAVQPPAMVEAEAAATLEIERILSGLYRQASSNVMAEARRQGISTAGLKPHDPPANTFYPMAAALALTPWTELLSDFQTEVLSPSAEVSELATKRKKRTGPKTPVNKRVVRPKRKVPSHLIAAADKALARVMGKMADTVKQDVHIAHGRGRTRTARKFKPGDIFASELLDGATCAKCRKMDGKEYDSIAAARRDYPEGPYVNCLGGARCRGTLVFLYNEPDPEDWENDDDS